MPQYKLIYFDLRFKYGELPRWILSTAGQSWEDVRLDYYQREDWNKLKPNTPFGQLPILETDGVTICQSNSIARFLAKRHGFAGKTEFEEAQVNMIVDCIEDMTRIAVKLVYYCRTEDEKAWSQKDFDEKVPVFLARLEALLKSNKGGDGYFVGDSLTWADMHLTLSLIIIGDETVTTGQYPKLCALRTRVQQNPGIASWLEKRPPAVNEKDV